MEISGSEVNDVRGQLVASTQGSFERRNHTNSSNGNTSLVPTYTQQTLTRSPPPNPTTLTGGSNFKTSSVAIRYRECLRNHAASVGGSVFDGCGEFMPGGEEGTVEALKCAACGCHRNFHRKELEGDQNQNQLIISPSSRRSTMMHSLQLPPPLPSPTMLRHRFSMGLHPNHTTGGGGGGGGANIVQPMTVAFGARSEGLRSGGTESSSEELNVFQSNTGVTGPKAPQPAPTPYVLSKKRFRTKFTQDQKHKMMGFAEKIGWRINKLDEDEVDRFCYEVGVRRQVFKVWMHNNKNLKQQEEQG